MHFSNSNSKKETNTNSNLGCLSYKMDLSEDEPLPYEWVTKFQEKLPKRLDEIPVADLNYTKYVISLWNDDKNRTVTLCLPEAEMNEFDYFPVCLNIKDQILVVERFRGKILKIIYYKGILFHKKCAACACKDSDSD